jgi:hypothetical protein
MTDPRSDDGQAAVHGSDAQFGRTVLVSTRLNGAQEGAAPRLKTQALRRDLHTVGAALGHGNGLRPFGRQAEFGGAVAEVEDAQDALTAVLSHKGQGLFVLGPELHVTLRQAMICLK